MAEVRDESDKDAFVRIVIDLKPNANKDLIVAYLFKNTDIVRICASNIVDNQASGRVLEKSGFHKIAGNVVEDWGYENKVIVDKWCLEKTT